MSEARPEDPAPWLDALLALMLPTLIVGAIYLFPFLRDATLMPFGADTHGYVWRATVVQEDGIAALEGVEDALGARPVQPVLVSILGGLTGVRALTWAVLAPAVLAVVIALAAGAFGADGLGATRRGSATYAIGVGGSPFVALTAYGYASNLVLDPMAIAIVLLVTLVAYAGAPIAGGVLLLTAVALTHYLFAAVLALLLGVYALLLMWAPLPEGVRAPSMGPRRVLKMLAGAAASTLIAFSIAPQIPTHVPEIDLEGFERTRAMRKLGRFALWITLPMAAVGGFLKFRSGSPRERSATGLLLLWAAMAPIAVAAWLLFDLTVPAYRWVGFALAIPILVVLAASEIGKLLPASRPGRIAAHGLMIIVVVGLAAGGASRWATYRPRISRVLMAQLSTVANVADAVPSGTRVAIAVRPDPGSQIFDKLAVGLPAEVINRLTLFPVEFERDQVDLGIDVPPDTVVLWIDAIDSRAEPPGEVLGPGVVRIAGLTEIPHVAPGKKPRSPAAGTLVLWAIVALAVLTFTGSGWADLARLPTLGRTALAPTFGIAALGLTGLLGSRIGIPFNRPGSLLIVMVATGLGWIAAYVSRRKAASTVSR